MNAVSNYLTRLNKMNHMTMSKFTLSFWIIILLFFIIQTLIMTKLVITDESLWIDELFTQVISNVDSFLQWWNQFGDMETSDRQLPLYYFYMFIWVKIFGYSEYALRMANWPLFLTAEIIIFWTFRRNLLFVISALTISSIHALLWYYLNEARPYILIYLGSTLVTVTLIQLYFSTRFKDTSLYSFPSAWLFSCGIILLAGGSLIGMPWAGVGIGLGTYMLFKDKETGKSWLIRHRLAILIMLIALLILFVYYSWTLLQGARASAAHETNLKTLAFSAYELIGVSGIGAGRLELREAGTSALSGYVPQLVFGLMVMLGVFLYSVVNIIGYLKMKDSLLILATLLSPMLFIFLVGSIMHWRTVGRHYIPLLPSIILIISYGVSTLLADHQIWKKAIALTIIIMMAASAFSMKLPRHAKDDYKSAAIFTNEALASGHTVWWAASKLGADYYKVPVIKYDCLQPVTEKPEGALLVSNLMKGCIESVKFPDLIVLSKPNDFDRYGTIRAVIKRGQFQLEKELPAFTIWRKPD